MKTETPRTDEAKIDAGYIIASHSNGEFVPLELAQQLEQDVDRLTETLRDVANPMRVIRREAEKAGNRIDGAAAFAIQQDPNFIKQIAVDALAASPAKQHGRE